MKFTNAIIFATIASSASIPDSGSLSIFRNALASIDSGMQLHIEKTSPFQGTNSTLLGFMNEFVLSVKQSTEKMLEASTLGYDDSVALKALTKPVLLEKGRLVLNTLDETWFSIVEACDCREIQQLFDAYGGSISDVYQAIDDRLVTYDVQVEPKNVIRQQYQEFQSRLSGVKHVFLNVCVDG
ncbi:hypothetical protein DCS_00333 [Drechmeria coniospora]|uniref:Uncharacterized protein n=1 Tax=Drechmeria coniospora TaxID=98403 RepID=A0A151GQ35_DRECN|nr:hypothetical protein DCS_00333 [Drechmeria coniospora]KYK59203.1 hypothetical protein DCS_00333 [Drechmeria coniospora]